MASLDELTRRNAALKAELARLEALVAAADKKPAAGKKPAAAAAAAPAAGASSSGGEKAAAAPEYSEAGRAPGIGAGAGDPSKLSVQDLEEIKDVFQTFDADGSGSIEPNELQQLALHLGEVWDDEELAKVMKELDTNKDGHVSLQEFLALWTKPRDRTDKTATQVGVLRAKLVSRYLMRGVPSLVRTLSMQKQEDDKDWIKHTISLSAGNSGPAAEGGEEKKAAAAAAPAADGVGKLTRANAGASIDVDVKFNVDVDKALFGRLAGCGSVITVALETNDASQSASDAERKKIAESVIGAALEDQQPPPHEIDVSDPKVTRFHFGVPMPDPLDIARSMNLDLNKFIDRVGFTLLLKHPLSSFIDRDACRARCGLPKAAAAGVPQADDPTLASLMALDFHQVIRFRKALLFALKDLPIPVASYGMIGAFLERTDLSLHLGDVEQFCRDTLDANGNSSSLERMAEAQRAQLEQLRMLEANGAPPGIADEMARQQAAQLAGMMKIPRTMKFLLSKDFHDTINQQYTQLLLAVFARSRRVGRVVNALRGGFKQLQHVHITTASGFRLAVEAKNALDLQYLPEVNEESAVALKK